MADRNQNHPGQRNWRSDPGRSNRWRDENEGRYSTAEQDRDYDFDYTRNDEGDSSVRAGSYDQGRSQYGRRDTNEQSGSTGRYAGYGNSGQGDYGRGGRNTGQGQYGQSGYGQGGYGTGSGGRSANRDREDYDYGYGRQGGYGGNYGQGQYGEGGSRDRFSEPNTEWRGHGVESDYGTSHFQGGRYSQGTFGTERGGWNEPYGEGQQYTSRGDYGSAGSTWGQGGQQGRGMGQHRGKGPKGYQRSDERLKEMISERLREDPHIDASDITVTVQGSRVTLEGTVDSRHTKNMVEDVAEQFGVSDVQNNLRVQKQQDSWRSSGTSASSGAASSSGGMSGSPATGSKGTTGDETESSRQKRN